jgi:hypothetical protein
MKNETKKMKKVNEKVTARKQARAAWLNDANNNCPLQMGIW